jgi:hypothetical protein
MRRPEAHDPGNGTWHSACRKVPSLPISHVRSCPIHASRKSPRGTPSPQALELGDLPRRRSASGSASRGRLQNRVHRNRGRQGCSPQFLGWLSGGSEQALREHINSERTGLPSIGSKVVARMKTAPRRGFHVPPRLPGWLGHRSITSTAVYTALAPNRFRD